MVNSANAVKLNLLTTNRVPSPAPHDEPAYARPIKEGT